MIKCYTVPEVWHMTDIVVIFHFRLFSTLLPPLTAQNIKIFKNWKKLLEVSSFYICVPKITIRWCTVPEIWHATGEGKDGWMDGWTDGQTDGKWHIEVGTPSKNLEQNQVYYKHKPKKAKQHKLSNSGWSGK